MVHYKSYIKIIVGHKFAKHYHSLESSLTDFVALLVNFACL